MDIDERNNKLKCSNLINMSTCFIQIIKCLYNNAPSLDAFTTLPKFYCVSIPGIKNKSKRDKYNRKTR